MSLVRGNTLYLASTGITISGKEEITIWSSSDSARDDLGIGEGIFDDYPDEAGMPYLGSSGIFKK